MLFGHNQSGLVDCWIADSEVLDCCVLITSLVSLPPRTGEAIGDGCVGLRRGLRRDQLLMWGLYNGEQERWQVDCCFDAGFNYWIAGLVVQKCWIAVW